MKPLFNSLTISSLKELLITALYAVLVGALVWNIPNLMAASKALLDRAGTVNAIEVEGVKIAFDQGSVFPRINFDWLTPAAKTAVLQNVRGLEPDEFERLMNIGELENLCDFEHPTIEMRRTTTLDYQLNAKGLASMVPSPDLYTEIYEKIKTGAIESGQPSDIGYPRSCYFMDYTDAGRDTKTAIVKILSSAFNQAIAMK